MRERRVSVPHRAVGSVSPKGFRPDLVARPMQFEARRARASQGVGRFTLGWYAGAGPHSLFEADAGSHR